jgi:aspartate kinase
MKQIIVQKFGGTCLQTEENRMLTARRIWKAKKQGIFPIVVVSAMGRIGDPYSTDSLLSLCQEAYEVIRPRERDLLLSCGEIISAVMITQNLEKMGLKAKAFTGFQAGIITDESYNNSNVIGFSPYLLKQAIAEDYIPVISGFQGMSRNGEITTLGRGGSDTSASLIASILQAARIEIYSDVEGIYTADPNFITSADLISEMTYREVHEMANQGAKVIHPQAVLIAENKSIPIHIRHLFLDNQETIIADAIQKRPVTAVTSKKDILFIEIKVKQKNELEVFSYLFENNISADFIDIRPAEITFIVQKENQIYVEEILQRQQYDFQIVAHFVKVSVIGSGMTGVPGIMAKIIFALQKENIKIYQTTDSHTTISCLIDTNKEEKALQALHDEFNLKKE